MFLASMYATTEQALWLRIKSGVTENTYIKYLVRYFSVSCLFHLHQT